MNLQSEAQAQSEIDQLLEESGWSVSDAFRFHCCTLLRVVSTIKTFAIGMTFTGSLNGLMAAARVFGAGVLLTMTQGLTAQAQVSTEANGVQIDGPPPPVAPAVISRDDEGGATIRAVRVTEPMRIDGELDEAFYRTTLSISDFVQTVPDEGAAPTEHTEAWVGFDDSNVYVAGRVWDSAPEDEWVANEMRRDAQQIRSNDNFGVFLDTFYDRRNAVTLYVNSLGAFTDLQVTNEGNPNRDWNPIVDIQTGRFDGGWTVEIAIPFKSLRYRSGREQVWGIQLRRNVIRKNEWNYLTFLPLSVSGNGSMGLFRVSMYGTLVGIEAPPSGRNLEIKPYAISGLQTDMAVDPVVSNDVNADVGLDIKYGITENLTADLTFNTDFAQVEVDEQQVNLTRFNLFFPEKREFFLEGRGIFNFGTGGTSGGGGLRGGPRRGGGSSGGGAPTLFYSRQIGLQDGEPTPILAGGRITGKIGSFDVGAVGIQTDDHPGVGAESTNFTVLRLRRDILARSNVGVLFENRSVSIKGNGGSNQAYGVDANFAFFDNVSFLTYYAKTRTEGLHGNDESYRSRFNYAADRWGASIDYLLVGDDFNPEIGFVRRKDFRQTSASGRFSPRPESIPWIRRLIFQGDLEYLENDRNRFVETRNWGGSFQVEFENSDGFSIDSRDSYENLITDTNISGATVPSGRYSFRDVQMSYIFGPQRRMAGSVSVRNGSFYSGDISSVGFSRGRIEVLPQLSIEPTIEFNWINLLDQQGLRGEFNQHVTRARVNYSLSPRTFVSGLVQYNAGSDTFSNNFRLRWEWAPGSELFVVYTEDRNTDVYDRWSELSSRGLVIKVNRLLRT